MNWKRAVMAAGVGAVGVVVICIGLYSFLFSALYNAGIMAFNDNRPSTAQWLLMLTIPSAMVSLGGALPARALGTGWRQSLIISLVAHVIGAFVLGGLLSEEPFAEPGPYMAAPFIPAAMLTVLLTANYGDAPTGLRVLVAMIAVAAVMSLLSLLFAYIAVGISAWILLPAVAALASE